MNSDSPLNWNKLENPMIAIQDEVRNTENISHSIPLPTFTFNTLLFILIILLTFLICIFIYQRNKYLIYNSNNNKSCDDDDYVKWD